MYLQDRAAKSAEHDQKYAKVLALYKEWAEKAATRGLIVGDDGDAERAKQAYDNAVLETGIDISNVEQSMVYLDAMSQHKAERDAHFKKVMQGVDDVLSGHANEGK